MIYWELCFINCNKIHDYTVWTAAKLGNIYSDSKPTVCWYFALIRLILFHMLWKYYVSNDSIPAVLRLLSGKIEQMTNAATLFLMTVACLCKKAKINAEEVWALLNLSVVRRQRDCADTGQRLPVKLSSSLPPRSLLSVILLLHTLTCEPGLGVPLQHMTHTSRRE